MCYSKFVRVSGLLYGESTLRPSLYVFCGNQTQAVSLAQQVFYPLSFIIGLRESTFQIEEYLFTTKGINTF